MLATTLKGVVTAVALLGAAVWADAGQPELPDAAVGQGGADRDNPEGEDGQPKVLCSLDRDCAPNFRCAAGRCSYVGPRTVGGCASTGGLLLPALALLLLYERRILTGRRRRSSFTF